MPKSQYDAIVPNIGGTNFTGYYKEGFNMKLSDGITVINVWKPERCPYYNGEVYKDAMIEISGNSKNYFTYQDMQKLNVAIEEAIDYLNKEKENLIDREKIGTYEHINVELPEKKKTCALKYAELQIGGIYLDDKKKKWIFLGEGTLLENGSQENRTNNGYEFSTYMYMEYPDEEFTIVDTNNFNTKFWPHPDTYASKKRFFEKVGQLPVNSHEPIIINCGSAKFECCHGIRPKSYRERITTVNIGNEYENMFHGGRSL